MDYVYIRAYHNLKGDFPYYTVSVVEQARREKAPTNATHKGKGGKWFFYWYYPAHLMICGLLRLALHGNISVMIGG